MVPFNEKIDSKLDVEQHQIKTKRPKKSWRAVIIALLLVSSLKILQICTGRFSCLSSDLFNSFIQHAAPSADACPQPKVIFPKRRAYLFSYLSKYYRTDEFRAEAIESISGAVRIPTESFDDLGPIGEDPRWDAFPPFHEYLVQRFPLVHQNLRLTKVNTYGLVYQWEGSKPLLKPLLLVAHQDVVPVDPNTVDQWEHPPYSGYFDGERIWGRGSSDDKSGLVGILSAVETLIKQNFKPTRPVVLTFGFDEECGGNFGAQEIVKFLLSQYGPDSFAMVVDEGGGFAPQYDTIVASPNVGEKGHLDVRVTVATPGGHSSVPPSHTSIGILAHLITTIESNLFKPSLSSSSPIYDTLQCLASHAPSSALSSKLRKAIKGDKLNQTVELLLQEKPEFLPLLRTTTAVDLVNGGVKANALPEGAWAVINHRISVESSIADVQAYYTDLFSPIAEKFNLSLTSFGEQNLTSAASSSGSLALSDAFNSGTNPIPKAPTFGSDAWDVLAGTIVTSFKSYRGKMFVGDESDIVDGGDFVLLEDDLDADNGILVIPAMSTGNTDVRFYGKLSENIYRYNHKNAGENGRLGNVHTVNESLDADAFVEMILFFTTLILNVDEANLP